MTNENVERNLATALAELQGMMPDIPHNQTANAGTYSYTYADLKSTTEALYPLMAKLGLSFTAKGVVLPDGRYVLRCSLLHVSGEREEGDYPLKADGRHQDLGSAISYGRRYMFCALTGAVTERDDDGQRADRPERKSRKKAQPPPDDQALAEPGKLNPRLLSGIQAGFARLGYGRDERLTVASNLLGREVTTFNDLTAEEGSRLMDAVNRKQAEVEAAAKEGSTDERTE